ncbi:MAG: cupredoxin domain-containing protein [Thaumarchaeota archaeon]|nr:cupredoxin domain-containing protein [Nitrososphaerota archaeon]
MIKRNLAISLSLVIVGGIIGVIYISSRQDLTIVKIEGESGVTIYNGTSVPAYSFSPAAIEVKKGTTLTWSNLDSIAAHTVISVSGLFESQLIQPRGDFSFQFNEVGVFDYYCSLHPWMKGKIIVR